MSKHNRGDPIAFRCTPLHRRLPFAEVDFNRTQVRLAHGGYLPHREAADIRHASRNEQHVSHKFRAGDESRFGDRADKGWRVAAL
jgi:hypothetical protein